MATSAAVGNVYGANLHWDTSHAARTDRAATIWQNKSNGKIFVWRNNAWEELATIKSANPPGTIITSLENPSVMSPLGWIPLDGRKVYETDEPSLFEVTGMAHLIVNDTPRYINLPNAQQAGDGAATGTAKAGLKVSPHLNNLITLQVANMPRHGHNPAYEHQPGSQSARHDDSRR